MITALRIDEFEKALKYNAILIANPHLKINKKVNDQEGNLVKKSEILNSMGRSQEAIAVLDSSIKVFPNSTKIQEAQLNVYNTINDDQASLELLELLTQKIKNNERFYLMMGRIFSEKGFFDKSYKKLNLPKPNDTALILLTSGSTGRPKLVPLTHRNVCISARDVSVSLDLSSNDRCLSMWELFHIGGLVDMLLAPLHSGGSIIATAGFSSMDFFSYSEEFSPTWFQGVPTTFFELVRYANLNSIRKIAPQQRFVRSVAAPLSIEMAGHITDLFDAPVITTFGMTEAGPLITSTSLTPSNNPAGSVGKSCGTEIATVDSKWNFLGLGEEGEIIVRGENVFSGYENDPIANENIFHKDWFRTGDIGYLDQQYNLL